MTFDQFYTALKSDEIWYNQICFMYSKKNMKLVAQECYTYLLSKPERFKTEDFRDFRACYQSFLKNSKDDYQAPQLQQKEEVKEEVWTPVSEAEREQKLKEWLSIVNGSEMVKTPPKMSYKEISEQGDWIPKKGAPYPATSLDEYYVRQRHLLYIKKNYEPRTGKPLPDFMPEDSWNELFEAGLIPIE